MARMLALAGLLVLAPSAFGQDHPEPPSRPAPKPIAPSALPPAVRDDSIPGLEDADFRLVAAPLRREGSFIVRQRGSMVRLPGGEKAMVFHRDAKGRAERPMVLMPCLTLQSMEQIAGDGAQDSVFIVTGQVFVYRGVNYLLPTAAPVASGGDPAPSTPTAQEQPTPADGQPAKPADPAVDDLIRELESQRSRPRTLGAAPKEAAPIPSDLMQENSIVSLKRGRLVRLNSGDWAFAYDNSPSGEAAADRTLVLSPCLNLERLESWASKLGDGATLLMSGRVYQYQGRNHLVPTMYQVTSSGELAPRQ